MKIAKIALGIVAGALLIVGGAMAVETDIAVDRATSTFTKSTFDYIVVGPSEAQVTEFKANPAVDSVFTAYNFEPQLTVGTVKAKPMFLLNEDLSNYDITFFNPRRIEEGEFKEDGIMLDRVAANKLQAKVGDAVKFSLGGLPFTLKVCSIYSEVNYQSMANGVAMAKFTTTMADAFQPKLTYHNSLFIAAKDKAKCAEMLKDYVDYGAMQTFEEFKATSSPNYTEEQLQEYYETYKAQWAHDHKTPLNVQDKAVYMAGAEDTVSGRKEGTFRLSMLFAILVPVVLAGGLIGFDFLGKAKDEAEKSNGRSRSSFLKNKLIFNGISAGGATVIALVGVLIYSLVRSSMNAGTLLLYSLPALAAFLIALPFVFLYTNKLYGKVEQPQAAQPEPEAPETPKEP